jgi:AraC-like DNA-binding protein
MATRANSLTDRVTKPANRTEPVWSMLANDVRAMVSAFGRLGYNGDRLLACAGLGNTDLRDPDVRIPCEVLGALISQAQKERFTPNLGLELALVTPIGAYPLLDYLVLTSDTVGAGARQLVHYLRLIGGPAAIILHEDVDPIRVEVAGTPASFTVEYNASLMVLHFRSETDGRFTAANVSFRHKPDDEVGFERILGCPIRSLESWNGVTIPLDAWRLPLRRRDPVLRQLLEARGNDILARLPARAGLALEVQQALTSRVAGGDTRIVAVARQLAMSGRTLQRRLAAEGVSYQELLDDARKETAGRHISESTLAIGEVAYLVGYSEPAPFHRAFKRWYGITPEVFRQKQRETR